MNTSTTEIKKTASLVRSLAQGRAAVWILASCLVLFGALDNPATAASAPARTPNDAPEGLSAGDWSSIRAARDAAQLAIQPNAQGYGARNPRQQWRTQFDQQGFLTHPDKGVWSWGLELHSYGFAGHERLVEPANSSRVEGHRVCYDRGAGLSEWLVNDERGLEHGFTIATRPEEGVKGGGPLRFVLHPRGNLRPVVSNDGVGFVDQSGTTVVTYNQLEVFDALGRKLPARFTSSEEGFALSIDERNAQYPLTIDPTAQQAYLKASNTDAEDRFGQSVAISGDTVVVGAEREDSAAMGVNGDELDNSAQFSGAAYVFVRTGSTWTQQAYIKASNTEFSDSFGTSVAISGDTVVVGAVGEESAATGVNGDQSDNSASFAGAAYVFVRTGKSWAQQAYLKASNTDAGDSFGGSVAISDDTVVVGALGESSAATGVNGDQNNNSADAAGAAYVFVRTGDSWVQQAYLKGSTTEESDLFGNSVAISGDTLVVGAENTDLYAGAAYVFERTGSAWAPQADLIGSNTEGGGIGTGDLFGWSVAISGDTVVVGAYGESSAATGVNGDQTDNSVDDAGAVYVFVRTGSSWAQQAYLKASNTDKFDSFGASLAISGDTLVVGAYGESSAATGVNGDQFNNGASFAGAVYLFVRTGSGWAQQAYLKASNPNGSDHFGWSVAISGDTGIFSADGESSASIGINGDQADNTARNSGAAYVFTLDIAAPPPPNVLLNISTRMDVLTGEQVLIGGFIVTGTDPKMVIMRAIGPSLGAFGIADPLADPMLELRGSDGSLITTNDNWTSDRTKIEATGLQPTNDLESAIVATLDPGAYTAIVSGKDGGTGVGLVEVYDLDAAAASELANISTRGFVETGNNVMIGGFILGGGTGSSNVLIRAIGPTLADFGVAGVLEDPTLELHDSQGALISSNDNWMDDQQDEIEVIGLAPQDELESAILATLNPGAYTAIVAGQGGGTGIGLVEVYRLP